MALTSCCTLGAVGLSVVNVAAIVGVCACVVQHLGNMIVVYFFFAGSLAALQLFYNRRTSTIGDTMTMERCHLLESTMPTLTLFSGLWHRWLLCPCLPVIAIAVARGSASLEPSSPALSLLLVQKGDAIVCCQHCRRRSLAIVLLLELATVRDLDDFEGPVIAVPPGSLNLLDDVQALHDLAEHNVAAIEPGSGHGGDEELRAVGVGTSVGHRQGACCVLGDRGARC